MSISEALKNIGMPEGPPPYRGNAVRYVTWQLIGQVGTLYAEGAEAETGVSYSVDVYAETRAGCVTAMLTVKAALAAAGWLAQAETEYWEKDIDRYHIVLTAQAVGAEYGDH